MSFDKTGREFKVGDEVDYWAPRERGRAVKRRGRIKEINEGGGGHMALVSDYSSKAAIGTVDAGWLIPLEELKHATLHVSGGSFGSGPRR